MPFFSCGAAAERGGGSLRECGLRFAGARLSAPAKRRLRDPE